MSEGDKPVFPVSPNLHSFGSDGITLRQLYAGLFMQSLMAKHYPWYSGENDPTPDERRADDAIYAADTLISRLNRKKRAEDLSGEHL